MEINNFYRLGLITIFRSGIVNQYLISTEFKVLGLTGNELALQATKKLDLSNFMFFEWELRIVSFDRKILKKGEIFKLNLKLKDMNKMNKVNRIYVFRKLDLF